MKCWMRQIKIELISEITGQVISFGNNTKHQERKYLYGVPAPTNNDNLTIKISGTKYPAANKDKGTIVVYNLNYQTIANIILGKYYKIKIYAGYKSWTEPFLIFSGSVAYISQKIKSAHDTECYIVFSSELVARYSQNRMNLTLNSSINLFAAMNYMLMSQGINNPNIDSNLKECFLNEANSLYGTASTILGSATLTNCGDYTISTDGTDGSVVDVTTTAGKRFIKITKESIPIGGGNPTVSSDGLNITLLPLCNFKVGDVLIIDNSVLDVSISGADSVTSTFNTNYMDSTGGSCGYYMIIELTYTLENRGETFQYQIKGRALEIIKNITT